MKGMDRRLYENFVGNVTVILEQRGLSRADLARQMGVTPSFVTQILNGTREPGLGVIERVAASLGVAPAHLLREIRQPA